MSIEEMNPLGFGRQRVEIFKLYFIRILITKWVCRYRGKWKQDVA